MAMKYRYVRVSDGEPESLSKIDDLMCAALGIQPDPEKYCDFFQALLLIGLVVAQIGTGSKTSKEAFEEYKAKYSHEQEDWDLVERFLVTEYNYECWR